MELVMEVFHIQIQQWIRGWKYFTDVAAHKKVNGRDLERFACRVWKVS